MQLFITLGLVGGGEVPIWPVQFSSGESHKNMSGTPQNQKEKNTFGLICFKRIVHPKMKKL